MPRWTTPRLLFKHSYTRQRCAGGGGLSTSATFLDSRATSQCQHVKGHLPRSHGSITWSTILSVTVCTGGSTAPSRCLKRNARSSLCQSSFMWCWTYGSHLPSGPASGSEEAVLPAVGWCAWVNKPTRDSWEHVGAPEGSLGGGCLFPTHTWEALLLTRVV